MCGLYTLFYNLLQIIFQEKVARLKKEGKFLTKAQKEQKQKADAMLAAMREQGTVFPMY